MRIYLTRLLAVCAALLFTGFSLYYLLLYTRSMDGQFHDLSMFGSEREMMEEWNGDTKGWTVFVQEGEMYHELDALGWGSYSGLDYPGQTVYFSRTMTEDVDSPTLRLYAANRAIAVFLGDKTLYTDSPEQDNKVGSLALSEFSSDREALTIALPTDYLGKTLTIAQSSPEFPDSPSSEVTICGVELYCSYTSQSDLISESFRTAVPATLVFTLGVLALAALLWQGFHGKWDMGLAMLAVMAFSLVLGLLSQASFSYFYFKTTTVDWRALCRAISLSAMLVFLGQRGRKETMAPVDRCCPPRRTGPVGTGRRYLSVHHMVRTGGLRRAFNCHRTVPPLAKRKTAFLSSAHPFVSGLAVSCRHWSCCIWFPYTAMGTGNAPSATSEHPKRHLPLFSLEMGRSGIYRRCHCCYDRGNQPRE